MPRPRRGAAEPHPPRTRHSNLGQSDHVRSAPMEELRERLAGPSHRCPAVILSRDHFSPAEIAPGTKGRTPAEASPTIQNSITVSVNRRTDSAFPAARKPRISFPPDAEIADTLPENATGGHLNRENRKSRSRPWAPQQHAIPTGRKKWLSRVSAEEEHKSHCWVHGEILRWTDTRRDTVPSEAQQSPLQRPHSASVGPSSTAPFPPVGKAPPKSTPPPPQRAHGPRTPVERRGPLAPTPGGGVPHRSGLGG